MTAISIEHLRKIYRSGWPGVPPVTALQGLSLSVDRGEIYGFLGPNGAGKTTTLKILIGLLRATDGKAEVLGEAAGSLSVRRRIGFLPEAPYFYDYLTAKEFLTFYGRLAGMDPTDLGKRIPDLLELVGLTHAQGRQLRTFSKGMLQRVGLAQAVIHDPELIILDEPMSGLDPVGRKQVRDVILGLRDRGKTVFFSSHIIPDVEMICDRVGIVMKGKLVASGRVDELVGSGQTASVEVVCEGVGTEEVPTAVTATRIIQRGRQCMLVLPGHDRLDDVLSFIKARGGKLISITPQKESLEALFLKQN
jgi:ABC-2 type transport system ATP-binding protein